MSQAPMINKPKPDVNFRFSVEGLLVNFQYLSTDFPENTKFLWDFGDNFTSDKIDPEHLYKKVGQYRVTLSLYQGKDLIGKAMRFVKVNNTVKTHLSESIYKLIDTYLPFEIFGEITFEQKTQFIEKWQLYMQPLVNHPVPLDKFNDELYYEALENQLIMELAAYDYAMLQIGLTMHAIARDVRDNNEAQCETEDTESSESTSSNDRAAGKVKKIITGPTEVEYFNSSGNSAETSSALNSAMKPGGLIDTLLKSICMLAERLEIYLPLCGRLTAPRIAPKNVNKRQQGFLQGPDPIEIVR